MTQPLHITSQAFSANVINKALTARPWVKKVGRNKYRVAPRTADHGKYELVTGRDDLGNLFVESCVDFRTGEPCRGFSFHKGNCYHAARLLIHLIPKETNQ